ncbi:4-(cytidine 5'-diphospho)-2-C-methyl-D-erythritol kinase [Hoeflea sp.]|uniref:4-(cytidine 5'-diphospho)-2-C-methyl-D-erythritol kinase n=1 Tax=Hoeflea sp. TaxID=1940281 RepID=UPI002AFE1604|nr:4-(cytidine 5'-diphospho)-2-C-methyl-D-erythritol kinase [Hoeflea sp.]
MLTANAPAKINLALHVTGQRTDGYHLIESLVVFTELGDQVSADLADADSFDLVGPEAGALSALSADDNLVTRARDALRQAAHAAGHAAPAVQIRLNKRLPVASGIGGGSADAAAALRLLGQLWNFQPTTDVLSDLALGLGADVPMCLVSRPLIASGIGEKIDPLKIGFSLDVVIVNPRIGVSTPAVFSALQSRQNPRLPLPGHLDDRGALAAFLAATRNDLEVPARQTVPQISACLAAFDDTGASFVRMSGSGASCFGFYDNAQAAHAAATAISAARPDWFVAATRTLTAE